MKHFYFLIISLVASSIVVAESTKIEGEYSYTYGDSESLLEAKSLCYTMAIRNAIESFTVYIQSTTTIEDYRLKNDLIQAISSGYIDNLTVEEEKVEGRSVYYRISGYVNPVAVKNVIDSRLKIEKGKELPGLDNDGIIKILKVSEDGNYINVLYQRIKPSIYKPDIYIDYYDEQGNPMPGDRYFTETLTPGEIRSIQFRKISGAKSYRVWLYKGTQ